jgi:hypothetical protein
VKKECRDETVRNYNDVVANLLRVEVREIPDNLIDVLCGYRSNLRSPTTLPHYRHVLRAESIMTDHRQGAPFVTVVEKYFSKWSTGGRLSSSQQYDRLTSLENTGLLPEDVVKGIQRELPEIRSYISASDRAASIMEDHGQKAPFEDIVKDHFTESTGGDPLKPYKQHERLDSLAEHLPDNVIEGIRLALPEIGTSRTSASASNTDATNKRKRNRHHNITYSGQNIYLGVFTDSEWEKFQNTFQPILDTLRSKNASSKLVVAVIDRCREKVSFQVSC